MSDDSHTAGSEARRKPRRQTSHEFMLSHPSIGKSNYRSRDLSLSGAFIEGSFQGVNPGDTIEIEFTMGIDPAITHELSASVARITDDGVGLKFLGVDMDTYGALLDLTMMT